VRDYLDAHPGEAPALDTLCRVTGVSARTLETAFQEITGLSPLHFIKTQLFNAARHALAAGNPAEVSVKIVARANGFWHLGRFAHGYRTLFGESSLFFIGLNSRQQSAFPSRKEARNRVNVAFLRIGGGYQSWDRGLKSLLHALPLEERRTQAPRDGHILEDASLALDSESDDFLPHPLAI